MDFSIFESLVLFPAALILFRVLKCKSETVVIHFEWKSGPGITELKGKVI